MAEMDIIEEVFRALRDHRKATGERIPDKVILNHDARSELDAFMIAVRGYCREPEHVFGMEVEVQDIPERVSFHLKEGAGDG